MSHSNERRSFSMSKKEEQKPTAPPMRPGGSGRHIATTPVVKAKNAKETLMRLWGYLRNQKISLTFVTLFTAISAVLMLTGPYLIGISIDRYIIPRDYNGLVYLCIVLLAAYLGSSAFSWLQMHVMAVV